MTPDRSPATSAATPPRPRVLAERDSMVRDEDWDRLAERVELVRFFPESASDDASFVEALRGFHGFVRLAVPNPALTRELLSALPDLRIIGLRGDRFGRGIDLEAADDLSIAVVDTDNISSAHPVAEWDLALILLCLRNAGAVFRQMMAGKEQWANAGNAGFVSGELTGKRVGLIGCGHVGQRLVELLAPFRVDLRVYDPYLPDETAQRLQLQRDELDGVLRHAEILVLQVPHTPKTEGMIGDRELGLLGDGKILINCSRGKVIDQEALIRRLEAGRLIAGLDVFDPEPLPKESPLRSLHTAFITPHIAWYAPHAFYRYFQNTALEIERFFRGETLQYALTRRMVEIRSGRL